MNADESARSDEEGRNMGKRTEAMVETPKFLAIAESYWVGIKMKDDEEDIVYVPVRRIDFICKRSGRSFRFPLTVRNEVASFGDTRDSALRLKQRYSFAEMRIELALMVGEDFADKLLDVFGIASRALRIASLPEAAGDQAA